MSKKIIRNVAKCRLCGEVLESLHLDDKPTCRCGEISIEGGLNYIGRFASTEWSNIIDLSEYSEDE